MAYTDALTGIANRARFHTRLNEALIQLELNQPTMDVTVLYFDLDDFKLVNDTYGHYTGDQLLREIAARVPSQPIDLFA